MNVTTIDSRKDAARRKFLLYRKALGIEHSDEDQILMKTYRALSLGKTVLNINDVVEEGGRDEQLRPCLACCRADAQWCYFHYRYGGQGVFSIDRFFDDRGTRRNIATRLVSTHVERRKAGIRWPQMALVPSIPPEFRPRFRLHNYHILWEAEWERVPVDPILLKRISGPFFAVLAAWDLTPLEQSVLGLRTRPSI